MATSDVGGLFLANNTAASSLVLPASIAANGFYADVMNINAGTVTLTPGTGAFLNHTSTGVALLVPEFASVRIISDGGTNWYTPPGLQYWQPGAGQVIALDASLSLIGGTLSVPGTPGGANKYYVPFVPGAPNSTISISATAFATKGNKVTFQNQQTITAVYVGLGSVVNAGSYVAQISTVNGSNVVQTVTNSATFVASGAAAANPKFSFSPGAVVNSGTTYAITCARIDSTGTFVLPTYQFTATTLLGRAMDPIVADFHVAATLVAVGATLTATASQMVMAFDVVA